MATLIRTTLLVALASSCAPAAVTPPSSGANTDVANTDVANTDVANNSNVVAEYLSGAEIQAETDAQRAELRRAFEDMLSLPVAELQTHRYAGYDGTPNVRTLPELLAAHVVPPTPQALEPGRFYKDVKAPAARGAIQQTLRQLQQGTGNPQ